MKTIRFCSLLGVLIFVIAGCAPQVQVIVPPNYGRFFHEASVDLTNYKSVQLRNALQDPDIALAVAASGGGHRAGNFTAGVMLGLESIKMSAPQRGNVLSQVDYFSTVSGGGFAAAAYLSSMNDHHFFATQTRKNNGTFAGPYSFAAAMETEFDDEQCSCRSRNNDRLLEALTDPCLKTQLERSYHGDILEAHSLGNLFSDNDRGDYLERAIDNNIMGHCWREKKLRKMAEDAQMRSVGLTLGDIFIPENSDKEIILPYWVANATVLANGAIFPFTPDHMQLYDVSGYTHRLNEVIAGDSEDTGTFIANMPMSVALRASANFPGVVPATTLRCKVHDDQLYLHLLDGGLGDNLGAITAMNLLKQDTAKRKVLIVIDAFEAVTEPYSTVKEAPGVGATIARTLMITLDSTRARVYARFREADQIKHPRIDGVDVIYISFEDMLCDPSQEQQIYDELIEYDEQYNHSRLETELREDLMVFDENGDIEVSPYELTRSVATRFDISIAQQDMLFAVGRYIVDKKKERIINAMGGGIDQ